MNARRLCLVLLALFLVGSVGPAMAQGSHRKGPDKERVKRWGDMDGKHKKDMRRRLKDLRGMEEGKRKAKLEQMKALREIMGEIYSKMDAATKARVDAMKPTERTKLLGQLAVEEARSRSREARLVLGERREPGAKGGPQGELSHKERKAMHEEHMRKGLKRLEEHVSKNGLPKGITQKEWDDFRKLKGRKFGKTLHRLFDQHPEIRNILKDLGPPPGRRAMDPELRELHEAMRLPPREHMKLVGPDGRPSRKQVMKSRRERVMKVLRKQKKLPEESLKKVEAMTDKAFMEWIHTKLGHRRGPEGRSGRGRGRGPESGPDRGPERGPARGPDRGPGARPRMGPDGDPRMGPPPGHRPRMDRGERPPRKPRTGDKKRGSRVSPHPDQNSKPKKD